MKLDPPLIARTALDLLDEVGLDGLTMRLIAKELDVRAPALYWHIKGKQELLDRMAELMFLEAVDGLEAPAHGRPWRAWLIETARRLRTTMLRYRNGARVLAGTNITHPAVFRTTELTLRTLVGVGFTARQALHGFLTMYNYAVGFTIEEQSHSGVDYPDGENPYNDPMPLDTERYPLAAELVADLWTQDQDVAFAEGLELILDGLEGRLG